VSLKSESYLFVELNEAWLIKLSKFASEGWLECAMSCGDVIWVQSGLLVGGLLLLLSWE
jgi:hypothetical protein